MQPRPPRDPALLSPILPAASPLLAPLGSIVEWTLGFVAFHPHHLHTLPVQITALPFLAGSMPRGREQAASTDLLGALRGGTSRLSMAQVQAGQGKAQRNHCAWVACCSPAESVGRCSWQSGANSLAHAAAALRLTRQPEGLGSPHPLLSSKHPAHLLACPPARPQNCVLAHPPVSQSGSLAACLRTLESR